MKQYSKVLDIPADEIVIMTQELYQEFCHFGCVPCCHLTSAWINIGDKFKLATVDIAIKKGSQNYNESESREVMLSEHASVEELKILEAKKLTTEQERRAKGGGCYRVNGRIVP